MENSTFERLKEIAAPVNEKSPRRTITKKMKEVKPYFEITTKNALKILTTMKTKDMTKKELANLTNLTENQIIDVLQSYNKTPNETYEVIEKVLDISLEKVNE